MSRPLLILFIELFFLILIATFALGCAYPLYGIIAQEFIISIIVMAMLFAFNFRLVVFFRQVAWLKFLAIQVILFLAHPVLFIIVLSKTQNMLYLFDAYDVMFFIAPDSSADVYRMNDMYHFFRKEFLFLSIGLMMLLVLTELRISLTLLNRVKEMK